MKRVQVQTDIFERNFEKKSINAFGEKERRLVHHHETLCVALGKGQKNMCSITNEVGPLHLLLIWLT